MPSDYSQYLLIISTRDKKIKEMKLRGEML